MKLEVTRKNHSRVEVLEGGSRRSATYKAGETFDGTQKELDAFKDRLKRAEVRTLVDDEQKDPEQKPLTPKQKLLAEAAELGVEADESMTANDIKAAIEAHKAKGQEGGEGSEEGSEE